VVTANARSSMTMLLAGSVIPASSNFKIVKNCFGLRFRKGGAINSYEIIQ
jgi:hypothetical protein